MGWQDEDYKENCLSDERIKAETDVEGLDLSRLGVAKLWHMSHMQL